jgi:hypothetical protein
MELHAYFAADLPLRTAWTKNQRCLHCYSALLEQLTNVNASRKVKCCSLFGCSTDYKTQCKNLTLDAQPANGNDLTDRSPKKPNAEFHAMMREGYAAVRGPDGGSIRTC